MGSGSARVRLLGLAAVKEYNGAADLAVVTAPGLVNPMSDLAEDLKRGQTDRCSSVLQTNSFLITRDFIITRTKAIF